MELEVKIESDIIYAFSVYSDKYTFTSINDFLSFVKINNFKLFKVHDTNGENKNIKELLESLLQYYLKESHNV